MRRSWFRDRGIGTLFLLPVTLPGWLSLAAFIALIAMSATIYQSWAWAARVGVQLLQIRQALSRPVTPRRA